MINHMENKIVLAKFSIDGRPFVIEEEGEVFSFLSQYQQKPLTHFSTKNGLYRENPLMRVSSSKIPFGRPFPGVSPIDILFYTQI